MQRNMFNIMDEFLDGDGEQNDSFNFELQEREAYDAHKVEYDKKTFHMNERKKIFEKKEGTEGPPENEDNEKGCRESNGETVEGDIISNIRRQH